jgi:hypothetical protein
MKYLVEKFNEETCESTFGVYGSSAVDKFDDSAWFNNDYRNAENEFADECEAKSYIDGEHYRKYRQGRFIPAQLINDLRETMTHTFFRIKELGGKITSDSYYRASDEYLGKSFHLARIEFADGTDGNARIEARIEFRYLCGMVIAASALGVTYYIGKDDTIKVGGCDLFYERH